jgi:hypothetical protein
MMETKRETLHRLAVLTFMAIVTACLLALVFGQTARGAAALPGIAVYALAAGFGLEFIGSAWTGRWGRPGDERQLQS